MSDNRYLRCAARHTGFRPISDTLNDDIHVLSGIFDQVERVEYPPSPYRPYDAASRNVFIDSKRSYPPDFSLRNGSNAPCCENRQDR
ncbi:MAG: hypothetical protein DWQ08_12310 [Proteobacteria bacterium]|nr:MAG: hypothetical protein DWQ08_12310 [Pseudomonadota bacterium]